MLFSEDFIRIFLVSIAREKEIPLETSRIVQIRFSFVQNIPVFTKKSVGIRFAFC